MRVLGRALTSLSLIIPINGRRYVSPTPRLSAPLLVLWFFRWWRWAAEIWKHFSSIHQILCQEWNLSGRDEWEERIRYQGLAPSLVGWLWPHRNQMKRAALSLDCGGLLSHLRAPPLSLQVHNYRLLFWSEISTSLLLFQWDWKMAAMHSYTLSSPISHSSKHQRPLSGNGKLFSPLFW